MTATTNTAENAEQELLDLEQQIAGAVVSNDIGFVERVFGDDFIYTGIRGEIKGKKEIRAEMTAGDLKFTRMEFDLQRVRLFGNVGLVTGRATTKGTSPQGEIAGEFRYTRVYVKSGSQWLLVAFHGTPILTT